MISIDASYILMPQFKKKSKSSVWSSPPTKLPWNQESLKACKFHLSRSNENKCQNPLVCHVLLLVNLPGSLPKLRQESLLQTQQGSGRAIPQFCWHENVCASHSDFSKPASSAAQRLVTLKEWTMTEVILFYIPMKKAFMRISLASFTQLKKQTNLFPQVTFGYRNLHCIVYTDLSPVWAKYPFPPLSFP